MLVMFQLTYRTGVGRSMSGSGMGRSSCPSRSRMAMVRLVGVQSILDFVDESRHDG